MLSLHVCTEALDVEDVKLISGLAKMRDSANTVHTHINHICVAGSPKKIHNVVFNEALRRDLRVSDSCYFV